MVEREHLGVATAVHLGGIDGAGRDPVDEGTHLIDLIDLI